jgi:hypothetical protein
MVPLHHATPAAIIVAQCPIAAPKALLDTLWDTRRDSHTGKEGWRKVGGEKGMVGSRPEEERTVAVPPEKGPKGELLVCIWRTREWVGTYREGTRVPRSFDLGGNGSLCSSAW